MQISLGYPWYFVALCLLLGAVYSVALYYVRWRKNESSYSRKVKIGLSVLRFLSVSAIAFLLLSPLVKRQVHEKEKPVILIAEDNSQSPMLSKDSAYYRGDYRKAMEKLIDKLDKNYEVVRFGYGSELRQTDELTNTDPSTEMAQALRDLKQRYKGRNVGAVVLTGDGIYNRGANPLALAEQMACPIYTVALGDTMVRSDAAIASTRYNREVLMGSRFPVEVTVKAAKLKGRRSTLTVSHKGKHLYSKEIGYTSDHFATTETVLLDAEEAGVQTYRIAISTAEGEVSVANNSCVVSVNVIDSRRKIAIVAAAPHPDVAAIRRSLEGNQSYDVSVYLAKDIDPATLAVTKGVNLKDCQLVILHQLPTIGDRGVAKALAAAHIPVIYIIGSQTDIPAFNALATGLTITTNLKKTNEVTASGHRVFAPLAMEDYAFTTVEQYPPLTAPFGDYSLQEAVQVLFSAKIGDITSDQPLIAVNGSGQVRTAFVVGEGMWRWRMRDISEQGGQVFDQLLSQLVLYTTIEVHDKPLRISMQPIYKEGEPVVVNGELYNSNFQPTNTADVKFTLRPASGDGEEKEYMLNRSGTGYKLSLGALPRGTYSYTATTTFDKKNLSASGSFVVSELNLEEQTLVADHSLLRTIAEQSGAQMATSDCLDSIAVLIAGRDDIRAIVHSHNVSTPVFHLWWVLALLVVMLAAEWAVRKYYSEI